MEFKHLKRFPKEKQEQVEQLMNYTTLMGLSGTDLISIGGRMERDAIRARQKANLAMIAGYKCLPVGKDPLEWRNQVQRFKLETDKGVYRFENLSGRFKVTSLATKQAVMHWPKAYEVPNGRNWTETQQRYVLLDIAHGRLPLDF